MKLSCWLLNLTLCIYDLFFFLPVFLLLLCVHAPLEKKKNPYLIHLQSIYSPPCDWILICYLWLSDGLHLSLLALIRCLLNFRSAELFLANYVAPSWNCVARVTVALCTVATPESTFSFSFFFIFFFFFFGDWETFCFYYFLIFV